MDNRRKPSLEEDSYRRYLDSPTESIASSVIDFGSDSDVESSQTIYSDNPESPSFSLFGIRYSDDGEESVHLKPQPKHQRKSFTLRSNSHAPPIVTGVFGGLEVLLEEAEVAYHEVIELLGKEGIAQAMHTQRSLEVLNEKHERIFLVTEQVKPFCHTLFSSDALKIQIFDLIGNKVMTATGPGNCSFIRKPVTTVKVGFGIELGTIAISGFCTRKYELANPKGIVEMLITGGFCFCETPKAFDNWVYVPLDNKYDGDNFEDYVVGRIERCNHMHVYHDLTNISSGISSKKNYTMIKLHPDMDVNMKALVIITALLMDYHRGGFACCSSHCMIATLVLFLFVVICASATLSV